MAPKLYFCCCHNLGFPGLEGPHQSEKEKYYVLNFAKFLLKKTLNRHLAIEGKKEKLKMARNNQKFLEMARNNQK